MTVTATILRTGVTRGLRPIGMPLPPQPTGWVATRRKSPVTYGELAAIKRLEIVQPLLVKMRKRPGRTSLLAALELIGLGRVDLDDVAGIVASWPDTPHLLRVRAGSVDDVRLWEDVREVADMHSRGGHGPERSVERLARALGVLEALLSVPEGQRPAMLRETEADDEGEALLVRGRETRRVPFPKRERDLTTGENNPHGDPDRREEIR